MKYIVEIALITDVHNNIVKISESLDKWKLLKTHNQTTYPVDVCIDSHFNIGKMRILFKSQL